MRYTSLWIIIFLFLGIISFSFSNESNYALAQFDEDTEAKPKPTSTYNPPCDPGASIVYSSSCNPNPCLNGKVCSDSKNGSSSVKCCNPAPPPPPGVCTGCPEGEKRCAFRSVEICRRIPNTNICLWEKDSDCIHPNFCEGKGECKSPPPPPPCTCDGEPLNTKKCIGNLLQECLPLQGSVSTCTFQTISDCSSDGKKCTSEGGPPRCICTRCNAWNINIGESTCTDDKKKIATCVHPQSEDGNKIESRCEINFTHCEVPDKCVINGNQAECKKPVSKPCTPDGNNFYEKCDPNDPKQVLICKWPEGYVLGRRCAEGEICHPNPPDDPKFAVCLPAP